MYIVSKVIVDWAIKITVLPQQKYEYWKLWKITQSQKSQNYINVLIVLSNCHVVS